MQQKPGFLKSYTGFCLGLIAGALVWVWMQSSGWDIRATIAGSTVVITATWWMSAALPVAVPAILPLVVLPLTGVLTREEIGLAFGHQVILLILGGSMISRAMQNSGAHRRIALSMVNLARRRSDSARVMVIVFALTAAFISMWISNTATTIMLVPVALAILAGMEESQREVLKYPLLLGIAYAASAGGLSTPIGTVPNVIFIQQYQMVTGVETTFFQWMQYGVPISLVGVLLIGWWLTRGLDMRVPEVPEVGRWTRAEARVIAVLGLAAVAWLTRKQPFGGWSEWLNLPGATDASVALTAGLVLFVISDSKGSRLLRGKDINNLQWDVLLLMIGGLCLASAMQATGISKAMAGQLSALGELPVFVLILCICLLVTFLTEVTSNTATAVLLMPLLASVAAEIGADPLLLMLPAAISASCAFMLPVATPPNAVVSGAGELSTRRMAREGLVLNLAMAPVIALYLVWYV